MQVLLKGLKNAESQTRSETMLALKSILSGLGSSANMCHRDVYKAAKLCLVDSRQTVRTSAAQVQIIYLNISLLIFFEIFKNDIDCFS